MFRRLTDLAHEKGLDVATVSHLATVHPERLDDFIELIMSDVLTARGTQALSTEPELVRALHVSALETLLELYNDDLESELLEIAQSLGEDLKEMNRTARENGWCSPQTPNSGRFHPTDTGVLDPDTDEDIDESEDSEESDLSVTDLVVFTQTLWGQGFTSGIRDLELRRIAGELASDTGLVEAITAGELERAKNILHARHEQLYAFVRGMDKRLAQPAQQSESQSIEQVLLGRLTERLDLVLTASVQRLPQALHRVRVDALTIRDQHCAAHQEFDQRREELILTHRQVVSLVAEIDRAFRKREATKELEANAKRVFDQLEAVIEQLTRLQKHASSLEAQIVELEECSMEPRNQGSTAISEIRRLFRAADAFGITLPFDVRTQMEEAIEPIKGAMQGCDDCFLGLEPIEVDPTLEDAMTLVQEERKRLNHILSPIRPSIFQERLDRDEELRRITLLTYYLMTRGGVSRGKASQGTSEAKKKPHDGFGRKSVSHSILVRSNLIDENEAECVYKLVGELKEARLLETNRVGRGWRYRPTEDGIEKAKEWLGECLNVRTLDTQVDVARKEHNKATWAQRRQNKSA
ncbi:hypothetical protein CO174_04525 [Candidatus Uhrbacteria bacterium CG_4_9_14_3_um_filter_50_9]|uniref:Uncharacterized protein n=1 Tax=Candidatus Uhrbacteria bacterium CG_4_9_14_3_um_filter_50_9 TaxID=1975035 RepID=A0A2M7XBD2_9BACT|nr:MAG: hypothetical protein CO174_04525 [Candidatus Uhrbacteria bacterium CG_4_9_14_3_um_filter_50_9]